MKMYAHLPARAPLGVYSPKDLQIPLSEPLDDTPFWNPDFPEAFRSLDIKIRVINATPDPANPTRPVLDFVGAVSFGTVMSGSVRMTPDDQIRWHSVRFFFSVCAAPVFVINLNAPAGVDGRRTTHLEVCIGYFRFVDFFLI
jgi:hypothetical protein